MKWILGDFLKLRIQSLIVDSRTIWPLLPSTYTRMDGGILLYILPLSLSLLSVIIPPFLLAKERRRNSSQEVKSLKSVFLSFFFLSKGSQSINRSIDPSISRTHGVFGSRRAQPHFPELPILKVGPFFFIFFRFSGNE